MIKLPNKLPFLEAICWQTNNVYQLSLDEMLSRYERGWRYRNLFDNIAAAELDFIKDLAKEYKSWLIFDMVKWEYDYHQKLLKIINCFDPEILINTQTYFGGGTLIALSYGEYRLSNDIDFISSVNSLGYRSLRNLIYQRGISVLFKDLNQIEIQRYTSDQYGIRMSVLVDQLVVKTELIAEARFDLAPPEYLTWCSVPCLSLGDRFTSKLLANSDRFLDQSIQSRDLIDLAMLRLQSTIPLEAITKAQSAYEVIEPLTRAISRFQDNPDFRERSFDALQIPQKFISKIMDGIDLLAQDQGLPLTQRRFNEQDQSWLE